MISPEPFLGKCRSLTRGRDLHLDVTEGRVRLAWMDGGAAVFMERSEVIGLGISYDMLLDALLNADGAANVMAAIL